MERLYSPKRLQRFRRELRLKDWAPHFRGVRRVPDLCFRERGADSGVTGLDGGVDEIDTPIIGQEGALHCIDGDLLEVVDRQPVGILSRRELLAHRRVAHQSVIGVERNPKLLPEQDPKGVLLKAARSASMHVAQQADFQWNTLVENILRKFTQLHDLAICDRNIVDQPCPMSDSMRSAILDSLPN